MAPGLERTTTGQATIPTSRGSGFAIPESTIYEARPVRSTSPRPFSTCSMSNVVQRPDRPVAVESAPDGSQGEIYGSQGEIYKVQRFDPLAHPLWRRVILGLGRDNDNKYAWEIALKARSRGAEDEPLRELAISHVGVVVESANSGPCSRFGRTCCANRSASAAWVYPDKMNAPIPTSR